MIHKDSIVKTLSIVLLSSCLSLASAGAFAQDTMKKGEGMAKDGMMNKDMMTMQQCKDHMAMAKRDGMKKDDMMMKKDTMCADMMKKDGMMNGGSAMQPDGMASGAMKK